MRKVALIAAGLAAILALALVLSLRFLGGDGPAAAEAPLVMGIDPQTTGNTCGPSPADCTLGTVESCVRVDVAEPSFDGASDYVIDVYVDDPEGIAPAPAIYDAWVYYDQNIVHIADPGTDGKIRMPGADFPGGDEFALPDSDGRFVGGWMFLVATPEPGVNTYIGDGPLLRLGLDIGASGVVTFTLDELGSSYSSLGPALHPLTFQTAQLAINEDCPRGGEGAGAESPTPAASPEPSPEPSPHPTCQPTPPPPPARTEAVRYRWANVSIEAPPFAGLRTITVSREGLPEEYSPSPGTMVPCLTIFRHVRVRGHDEFSYVWVDAATGQVVHQDVRPEDRAEFDAVLATLRFEGPGPPDVWPYSETPPEGRRRQAANITYIEPDPASGISVGLVLNEYDFPRPPGASLYWLDIWNGRSRRAIDAETGQVIVADRERVRDQVDERDREAFDRLTSSIEVVCQ
jgi:hypothetical protein